MLQTAFVEKHFDTIAKLKKKVGENMEEPKYNISFSVTPLKDVASVCYSWYNGMGTSGSPLGLRSNRSLLWMVVWSLVACNNIIIFFSFSPNY